MRKAFLISLGLVCFLATFAVISTPLKANSKIRPDVILVQELELQEALQKLTDKYQVYFTYDKSLIQNIVVEYHEGKTSIEEELSSLLHGTDLQFRIFENQYVIIYKLDDQGIRSLKSMMNHFEKIIAEDTRHSLIPTPKLPLRKFFDNPYREPRGLILNVEGVVVNSDGEPLIGVNVQVKGTNQGTATDFEGRFALEDINENDVLVFSYIGYQTVEIPIDARTYIEVILIDDSELLDEVVIVGYGSQRKSDLTGSVSSIRGDDITRIPTQRADQAIQGQAAGVVVLNTDGAPGGNVTIRIRGMNSINGGNDALIVVDGLQGGDLSSLNPNDIESIEVLKDASATAIYGSQGANGVVLITTKTGKRGKPRISYDINYSLQQLARKLEVMDAAEFATSINDFILTQNGSGNTPTKIFTDEQIRSFEQNGGTDWQDVIYRTAPMVNHQLSASGGTEDISYLVSGAYLDHQGILENSSYERFSLRANISAKINDWIDMGVTWYGTKEAGNSPPFGNAPASFLGNPVNVAPRWGPTEKVFDESGNYTSHGTGYGAYDTWNPLASAREPLVDNNIGRNNATGYLQFKFLKNFSLKITGGAIINNYNNRDYYNLLTYDGRQGNGLGHVFEERFTKYQNSNILTYNNTIGKHHITATAIAEQQISKSLYSSLTASNFLVDQTGIYDLAGAGITMNTSDRFERTINSYLGRINYGFADKYLLTASFRADGSSVFGKNNKWGYFPSISAAWRLGEEAFIRSLNVFSDLKLRISWGVTGNQAITPYQTLARILSGANYPYNGQESTDLGFYVASAANPNLKWESTDQTNVGVDFGFWQGRFSATVDYYKKVTDNLLLSKSLPGYTGLSTIIANVGSTQNSGVETTLSVTLGQRDITWTSSLNVSYNDNKVLDLGDEDRISYRTTKGGYSLSEDFMFLVEGEPFGQMYGYGYEGTWKSSEADEAAKYGQLPGDPKYTDVDGDYVIDDNDLKIIGNAMPEWVFGWNNSVTFKNFDISMLWQGTQGNDVFNQTRIRLERPGEGTSSRLLDRWTPDNQDTDIPAFIDDLTRQNAGLSSTVNIGGDQRLSRWVEDASYLRLKNLTVSYQLPAQTLSRLKVNSIRIFISGTNLITFTGYTGYDPEVSSFNSSDATIGVDFSNYPVAKTYTLGASISF